VASGPPERMLRGGTVNVIDPMEVRQLESSCTFICISLYVSGVRILTVDRFFRGFDLEAGAMLRRVRRSRVFAGPAARRLGALDDT
jgi:hypothetical protein